MSHAEAVALLDAASLVPGRIRALASGDGADGVALRRHLDECAECRGEVAAWQAVDEALVVVTPATMSAPPAAKARILSNVVATGVARGPDRILGATSGSAAGARPVTIPEVPVGTPTPRIPTPIPAIPATPAIPAAVPDPAVPNAGRVWRAPGGAPMPAPTPPAPFAPAPPFTAEPATAPTAAPSSADPAPAGPDTRRGLRAIRGGRDGEGVGFRVFLAVAAAAVFLFALGAALGGPLGLTGTTTAPDTTARVELEKTMGRMADLLQLPGATVAPLTDLNGEPAGAVVVALPQTNLLGVVTRALPALPEGGRYVCILQRDDQRYEIGYMKFAADPTAEGDVAYWVGPLKEDVPLDAGRTGDVFKIFVDGDTAGQPLLSTTF